MQNMPRNLISECILFWKSFRLCPLWLWLILVLFETLVFLLHFLNLSISSSIATKNPCMYFVRNGPIWPHPLQFSEDSNLHCPFATEASHRPCPLQYVSYYVKNIIMSQHLQKVHYWQASVNCIYGTATASMGRVENDCCIASLPHLLSLLSFETKIPIPVWLSHAPKLLSLQHLLNATNEQISFHISILLMVLS